MTSIEVDFDVYKVLTMKRETESVTYNDVLRKMLGLGAREPAGATTAGFPILGVVVHRLTDGTTLGVLETRDIGLALVAARVELGAHDVGRRQS